MANGVDGTPLLHEHGDEEGATATDLLRTQERLEGRRDVEEAYSKQERSKFKFKNAFDWRAPAIILGFTCLENLGLGGISTNLVIYLGSIFGEDNASIATSVSTWAGTAYLTPFLGALLADAYLGSYRTIVYSSFMYLAGMVAVTLSASLQTLVPLLWTGSSCSLAMGAEKIAFYCGLYLMAFGSGGVKSSLLPLGADQFDSDDPMQGRKKASFFNWFYFCMNLGGLTASTLIVWAEENVGWAVGFGISTLCMALATGGFLLGTPIYRLQEPRGSPLKRVVQVVVSCLRRRKLRVPADGCCLYEVHEIGVDDGRTLKLEHTDQFRFLDKAACMSDFTYENRGHGSQGLCTVTQVEEVKIIIRLLPIWLTSIVYSVAYAQLYSTFVEQGRVMNTDIGFLSIPPASLYAFEILSVMLWVLTYDNFIVKALSGSSSSRPSSATEAIGAQLRRMGVGCLLMVMALAAAAAVEMRRLARAGASKDRISVLWQLPQYFIIGGSEVFFYIGQLEFFYDQGPDAMRSMSTAMSLLAISLGSYLSSALVAVVQFATGAGGQKGWLPDDLDQGHLDYYYWCLALVSFLNFIAYVVFASRFRPKRLVVGVPS